jgi:hypothetical protein
MDLDVLVQYLLFEIHRFWSRTSHRAIIQITTNKQFIWI